MDYDGVIKLVVIGNSGVGKSAFLQRVSSNEFNTNIDSTIGVDFASIKIHVDNRCIKVQIWDTAGLESFKAITQKYYRGSKAAIVMFDINNYDSFKAIESWVHSFLIKSDELNPVVCLVGNKIDINQPAVTHNEIIEIGNKLKIDYFGISVKNDSGIELVLNHIVRNAHISPPATGSIINTNTRINTNSSSCC